MMERRKVVESLSQRVIASQEPPAHDAKTLGHNDIRTPWIILLLASGLGAGFSPFAPGTAGTLVAIPIELLLSLIRSPLYELTIFTFFFFSSWIAERAQNHWQKSDDRRIVIDEIMGYFLTMLWVPKTTLVIILGFFLFRFFDIVKPPPIRLIERAKGGFGVVLDDVLAGVYSNIILQIICYFTLSPGGRGVG